MNKTIILIVVLLSSVTGFSQLFYSQFSSPSGNFTTTMSGFCLGCSFSNVSQVADMDPSNFATITISAGLTVSRGIRAKLNGTVAGNTRAGFYISTSSLVSALPRVTVNTYKNGAFRETIVSNGNIISLMGGDLGYICEKTSPLLDYDEVGISFSGGIATVALTAHVYYAYGGYAAADCPVFVLPVKFIDVSTGIQKKQPVLSWKVDDNGRALYEVQRSMDGTGFTTIGTVVSSDAPGPKGFSFTDNGAGKGDFYYRVSATENNSVHPVYSKIVRVTNLKDLTDDKLSVFPNPVTGKTFSIALPCFFTRPFLIQLADGTGKIVHQEMRNAANRTITVQVTEKLLPGIYILKVEDTNSSGSLNDKVFVL